MAKNETRWNSYTLAPLPEAALQPLGVLDYSPHPPQPAREPSSQCVWTEGHQVKEGLGEDLIRDALMGCPECWGAVCFGVTEEKNHPLLFSFFPFSSLLFRCLNFCWLFCLAGCPPAFHPSTIIGPCIRPASRKNHLLVLHPFGTAKQPDQGNGVAFFGFLPRLDVRLSS